MDFKPEEDLSCPICHEVFEDPVLLLCSHSFCKECLRSWWTEKPTKECPVCKRRSSKSDPPCNLVLKNLCQSYTRQRNSFLQEEVCNVHSEKFKLFCINHQRPVCVVCRDSVDHRYHKFKPIDEAAERLKMSLLKSLAPIEERLKLLEEFNENCDFSLAHIRNQSRQTERHIQDQFKKLHQFLLEEEEARMKALREEEELKTQRMKDKMASVSREIEALSETIRVTEEQLRAADVCFLLKYKTAVERVQRCPLLEETQLGPGALIDQAKHLGNLVFNIWTNMKRLVQYTPVILDPNTAHPELVLSDDLTSLTHREAQRRPHNPERARTCPLVRGSEGFKSGSHSWDVSVEDNTHWTLGVTTERTNENPENDAGMWSLQFSDGEYTAVNMDKKKDTILKSKSNPSRIRVHLELNKHKLTFYDVDTNSRIHSFTQMHHKQLFPVFGADVEIEILPQKNLLCV